MAQWQKPISKIASGSRNLKDEEVVKALMEQAGVQDKEKKATFLQKFSSILGSTEWSDDALKTLKSGGNFGDFLGSYLLDIPRTIAGNLINKKEWIDPDEGKGVELMKYLGMENKAGQYIAGTAADILEPSILVGGAVAKGAKTGTKVGATFLDDIAKAATKNSDDAVKLIGKEFGEKAAKSAAKRVAAGDDVLRVANDYVNKFGIEKGMIKEIEPGMYLGSAKKGVPIIKGTIPGYIARMIESPITGPFEIGGDVARKTGLLDTKIAGKISKGLEKNLFEKFDFQHTLKKTGDQNLIKVGSETQGISGASEFAGKKAGQTLEEVFEKFPKKQQKEFLDKSIKPYIEMGGGIPQNTTVKQFAEELVDWEVMSKKAYTEVMNRMPKELKNATFNDLPALVKGESDLFGREFNLEQAMGTELYNKTLERLELIPKYQQEWDNFTKEIGYTGNKAIQSLDDVKELKGAIAKSNLDDASKIFYTKYVADIMEANLKIGEKRTALGLGDFGAGYLKSVYNIESVKDLPEGALKKNLIETKKRSIISVVDKELYDKYSTYELKEELGAQGLVRQITGKAAQDEAVTRTYQMYKVLTEQVEEGLLDGFGIEGMKKIPANWKKTGIPMLDEAGVVVDPKIWETIKDTNKFLVGDGVNYDSVLGLANKFNTWWRGLTTAMTIKVGKKGEIPLNPAYYIRNWTNNKMANVLYGGMNPSKLPVRYGQGMKVWNFIENSKGGDDLIGGFKVSDIAQRYMKQGGLSGTDIADIRRVIDPTIRNAEDLTHKVIGSGELAQKVESIDKLSLFIDQKLKNVDDIAAMDKVRFSLFDYAQLTDFEKQYAKPLMAFYCVPESAEILTRDGWKYYQDLRIEEEVLSYNQKKKVMEWTPLKGIATFEHDQELYEFANKRYSFMFTDEHRWITREQKTFTKGKWYGGKEGLVKANELTTGDSIRVIAPYVTNNNSVLTPEQARLLGWIITDGHIRTSKLSKTYLGAVIYQSPKKFLEEVKKIAGGNVSKPHPDYGVVCVSVTKEKVEPIKKYLREYLDNPRSLEKVVTRLSKEALEAMFEAMYKADGTVALHRKKDSMFFAAEKEEVKELFRIISTLLGYRTSSSNRGTYLSQKQYLKVEYNLKRKHYKGIVWCPQTDNETWVMRQNGFITITGNTWSKKNMVSFFATLAKDPNRMKIFDDIFKGFGQLANETNSDIKEILPDYLQEAYSYINGGEGQVGVLYGFGTNVEAVGDVFGRGGMDTARGLLSAMSPSQRMVLELASDYNFFKQKPITEDTSAYAYRNMPDTMKSLIGIEGSTFKDKNGKEVTTYKMNPYVKYAVENFRPATSLLKMFNITTNEGMNNEMVLDLMNYVGGVRYQQYDTEYLRRQLENERYKQRMQMLMDKGYVSEYKNYYIPKDN